MLRSLNLAFSVHFIALQVGSGWQYSNNEGRHYYQLAQILYILYAFVFVWFHVCFLSYSP